MTATPSQQSMAADPSSDGQLKLTRRATLVATVATATAFAAGLTPNFGMAQAATSVEPTGDEPMTGVREPGDLIPALAAAYQTGQVENMVALYEPDAVLLNPDGAEHRGHDAITQEFAGLIALNGIMTSINRYTVVHGDSALLSAEWRIDYEDANGAPMMVGGRSAEVAHRQADGRWLYTMDHPIGGQ